MSTLRPPPALDPKIACRMPPQNTFHRVRQQQGIPLRDALMAVYACFLESPFTMQIGLFIMRLDRDFALQRFNDVLGPRSLAA